MSTDFQGNGHDAETQPFGSTTAVRVGAPTEAEPTETLVASAVGDRCVNCGATLQSDQRYCVVCGERRGAPRFALPAPATTETTTTTSSISGRDGSRSPRFGSATTLIAGVGTLLLALLVGFLIGNAASKNNTKTVSASNPPIKVINVGGSSSGTSSTPASTTPSSGAKTSSGSHKSTTKTPKSTVTKKQANAESNAASKTLGGNGTPPANTKVGQKCSGSACNKPGYNKKTKKFDGSFFGQ
jgi:hypothetical protein